MAVAQRSSNGMVMGRLVARDAERNQNASTQVKTDNLKYINVLHYSNIYHVYFYYNVLKSNK